ncbi:AAA family ATPase [Serratia sp. D1N4]
MSQINKIHIMGASGSGTTSIAARLSKITNYQHIDTDDIYWHNTTPPFTVAREYLERQQRLLTALNANKQWILSGSLCGWGDRFIPYFDLVVYVYVKNDVRIERIRKRELARYGEAISPGGEYYEKSQSFIEWASAYDTSTEISRNAYKHKKWLESVECPVVEITNHTECDDAVKAIMAYVASL